ncbi:acetyl-CoA C-acyltransferase [Labrenzia sp. 011]|uniref:acetyl-CoA C-acyltransferase n=1 Tax=Labrenzia sp. 011 TaxID=2171494 RepID=UPI000D509AFC|nr:acetyl-CoA C-acyltransferase [Labrenzia sp. 011]PVB60023.1 acetyl-CoA C-acyltransferase [Labrenzia sp. 011]
MTARRRVVIAAARRTAIAPRGGALSRFQADELAASVLARLIADGGLSEGRIDHVILGNALYGGGNPARLAALRAGLPPSVPALTVDTQCCSGLDAILLGARMIEAGAADCVLAGGTESFSRAPIRMHRPQSAEARPVAYDRPAFAPPPYEDPDLAAAAARLAAERGVLRTVQADFAVQSHAKAAEAANALRDRLVQVEEPGADRDSFTRALSLQTALRAPVLAGSGDTGLSAATICCQADGAAAVLLVAEDCLTRTCPAENGRPSMRIVAGLTAGGDPAAPALAPIAVARSLLAGLGLEAASLTTVELMEAYAVQAMVTVEDLGIDPRRLNPLGGALARGHPVGASGAVLAVQLFERLRLQEDLAESAQFRGMALIAAAGGLAAGLVVEAGPDPRRAKAGND